MENGKLIQGEVEPVKDETNEEDDTEEEKEEETNEEVKEESWLKKNWIWIIIGIIVVAIAVYFGVK